MRKESGTCWMSGLVLALFLRRILDREGIPVVIWLNRNEARGIPMLISTGNTAIT